MPKVTQTPGRASIKAPRKIVRKASAAFGRSGADKPAVPSHAKAALVRWAIGRGKGVPKAQAKATPKAAPDDAEAAAERLKVATWGAALAEVQAVVAGAGAGTKAATERLGLRARALLRGIEIQEADLERSGGTYDLGEVERLLRVTRQRVHQLVQQGDVLAVPGPGNRARYPSVQFHVEPRYGRAVAVQGLAAVRAALGTSNPWMVLNYLVNPDRRLGGRRPVDLLFAGKSDAVVRAAEAFGQMGS